jgi:cytochrome c biogenesis protein CcdA
VFLQGIDGLPDEIMDMIYHVTFTARRVQFAMQCVLPVLSIALLYLLVRRIRCHSTTEDTPDVEVVTPK